MQSRFLKGFLLLMARYEHLPIYKGAMDLTVSIEQVVRNFSRYHKYTLGSDLRQQSRELVTLIIRANSRPDKLPVLYDLRERLEALQVLLRIRKEVQAFQKFNSYAHAAELVVALCRQNEGWIKGQSGPKRSSPKVGSGAPSRRFSRMEPRNMLHERRFLRYSTLPTAPR